MKRLVSYLKQEGILATLKRLFGKIFHFKSTTVFLMLDRHVEDDPISDSLAFELLSRQNICAFERIKFWSFIDTEDFICNSRQSVLLLKNLEEYVAYAAEEHEQNRIIHKLGCFELKSGQGWIGPVYVSKKWRGNGFNRLLLLKQIHRLRKMGINKIFTSINSRNQPSLKSFKKVGFVEIGVVNSRGQIVKLYDDCLNDQFTYGHF